MTKKTTFFFRSTLLMIPVLGFLVITSYSTGAPNGYSGSPGDSGNYCSTCHNGTNATTSYNNTSTISSNIPASGYALGQTYTITVTPNSSAPKHGFEITAEKYDSTNDQHIKIGGFTAVSGETHYPGAAGEALTHDTPITSGVWSFDWTAPSTSQGTITFYAAINAVNGDGAAYDTGDFPITTSLAVNEATASIVEAQSFFKLQSNPVQDTIILDFDSVLANGEYAIYDLTGKLIKKDTFINIDNLIIDTIKLSKGLHILKVKAGKLIQEIKFIKQ